MTPWAGLPTHAGGLITANVDILAREKLHHLVEHILDKLQRVVFANTQDVIGNAPHTPHLIGASSATQLGIGGQCTQHVAGHVNLGNDGNIAIGSIAHDVDDFLLGVVTAVSDTVIHGRIVAQSGAVTPTANLGQSGIFLDFHAPALVIG